MTAPENNKKRILITGAAGNLGNLLAQHLKDDKTWELNLLIHKKDITETLKATENVHVFKTDLAKPDTLYSALQNVDVIVYFAGVLFKANPQKFLPLTNTFYFDNLLDVAIKQKVQRIILISFPHVEGESTPQHPATGRLDKRPTSLHAQTRLQEEYDLEN